MKTFLCIIKYILNLPLWFLSKITKNNKIWVFGAWFGQKYADNSKYLFEYVNKYCPEITAIWLTEDDITLNLIRDKGYKAYKTYSFMGYIYSLFAGYGFVSTAFKDINIFPTGGMRVINLWHGSGASKKVGMDYKNGNMNQQSFIQKLKKLFFPFTSTYYYSCIATSETTHRFFSSAFGAYTKRVDIIGQPRDDAFYHDTPATYFNKRLINLKTQGKKIGIYMPTHRKEGNIDFSKFLIDELDNMNNKMKENNIVLLIKLHFYHQNDINNLEKEYSNIIFVKDCDIEQDVYEILPLCDFLITDYSSVYVDFLHSGMPIIFFPFDRNDYIKTDRVGYMDYDDITPGPVVYTWDNLYDEMVKIIYERDEYIEQRKNLHNLFSLYQDGKNCERMVKWIKNQ